MYPVHASHMALTVIEMTLICEVVFSLLTPATTGSISESNACSTYGLGSVGKSEMKKGMVKKKN